MSLPFLSFAMALHIFLFFVWRCFDLITVAGVLKLSFKSSLFNEFFVKAFFLFQRALFMSSYKSFLQASFKGDLLKGFLKENF